MKGSGRGEGGEGALGPIFFRPKFSANHDYSIYFKFDKNCKDQYFLGQNFQPIMIIIFISILIKIVSIIRFIIVIVIIITHTPFTHTPTHTHTHSVMTKKFSLSDNWPK